MSTEPTTPEQFPRIQLPPLPAFSPLRTPADELPAIQPLRDEPATTWQSPLPEPVAANTYTYMVAPPPLAPLPMQHHPRPMMGASCDVAAGPAPSPTHTPQRMPMPEIAVTSEEPAPALAPAVATSVVALAVLAITAVMLAWASRMAFSPALLALAGLMVSELAIGLAASARGASRPTSATVAAAVAIVCSLLALKGALGGFSEMAFVASLFVLVAALPTLILLGVLAFVLHRRRSIDSPGEDALRAGTPIRFGATAVVLVSGYLAKDSFSAKPDTFVAFAVIGLTVWGVTQVLRGTGRVASAD